jgi:hypothetical protein
MLIRRLAQPFTTGRCSAISCLGKEREREREKGREREKERKREERRFCESGGVSPTTKDSND